MRVSGDTAWATLRDQFVRKNQNSKGKEFDYHGLYTLEQRDGRWLISNISQTEQNVKYLTRYTIRYSNGLRLETYLPPNDLKAGDGVTGGSFLQERLAQKVDPVYPEAARSAGVSGEVVFLVTMDGNGSIGRAIRLMGDPILADAAATAMRRWKVVPEQAGHTSITCDVMFAFRPDGSVDTSQTAASIGIGSVKRTEVFSPEGFPKPEDFLIGEPPDGLAALSQEVAPMFVRPTPVPRNR